MRVPAAAIVLTVLFTGCANSQREAAPSVTPRQAAAAPAAEGNSAAGPNLADALKVPLPYIFVRHGADIRVVAVELKPEQVLVSVTFNETRNEVFELTGENLMTVRTTSGQELPYEGYLRDAVMKPGPTIPVGKGERFTAELVFKRAAGTEGLPVTIAFPSGKWWGSE